MTRLNISALWEVVFGHPPVNNAAVEESEAARKLLTTANAHLQETCRKVMVQLGEPNGTIKPPNGR